jgi:predicted outer membrane protein
MLAFALATGAPTWAAVSSDDASFVQSAQQDVLGNYALASLARNKAQDPSAKALADRVAANAAQASIFIKSYAKTHAVALESQPSIHASNQYSNISSEKGPVFDKGFAQAIYVDANMALDTYKDEAASGSDPALRDFAKKQLAAMQQFSKTAQKLAPPQ